MKSIFKWIKRFTRIMAVSALLLVALNIVIFAVFAGRQTNSRGPYMTAEAAAKALEEAGEEYALPKDLLEELETGDIWALWIDNSSGEVLWHTDNLPEEIPLTYTISDIAGLTRGYVKDYPTFTGQSKGGLAVLGYPKDSYWKQMWPCWDLDMIAHFPQILLFVIACNTALIFLIYIVVNAALLKSIRPIAEGIQALPSGEQVHIKEKGVLSELAGKVNQTSELLQTKEYQLKKKDAARANWIAGVSHDIRTPLSMVMGYAGQLAGDEESGSKNRKRAEIIIRQSNRIKNLVNDLNLTSKLEYNMQPLKTCRENAVAIVRKVVVDFINLDLEGKYPVEWETAETLSECWINVDKELLNRAVENLIGNCMNHNEDGCTIYVEVEKEAEHCVIRIEDNGAGITDEQLERLNSTPHYMIRDEDTTAQRHGLGLLIVRQIAGSHGGEMIIDHSRQGGVLAEIRLPAV